MSIRALVACTAAAACLAVPAIARATPVQVFFTDFNSGAPVEMSGITTTVASPGGYAADGFTGSMLRNVTGGIPGFGVDGDETVLSLTGLASHTSVDLNFLLAIIDSWDGVGGSPGAGNDAFTVTVDGVGTIFSRIFAIQSGVSNYVPGGGVQIGGTSSRGFNGFNDQAFDMGNEALFSFAHSASTLTVRFHAGGSGWQGAAGPAGDDESWGMDNLEVIIDTVDSTAPIPEPATLSLVGLSLVGGAYRRLRQRRK